MSKLSPTVYVSGLVEHASHIGNHWVTKSFYALTSCQWGGRPVFTSLRWLSICFQWIFDRLSLCFHFFVPRWKGRVFHPFPNHRDLFTTARQLGMNISACSRLVKIHFFMTILQALFGHDTWGRSVALIWRNVSTNVNNYTEITEHPHPLWRPLPVQFFFSKWEGGRRTTVGGWSRMGEGEWGGTGGEGGV